MYQRQPDFETDLAAANDPKTDGKELYKILMKHHGEMEIACAVAKNPSCSFKLFIHMWRFGVPTAEDNPNFEAHKGHQHWESSTRHKPNVRYSKWRNVISENPVVYSLAWIMEHGDGAYQRAVMAREPIPAQMILDHVGSKSAPLRKVIASRKTAPEGVFERLAKDKAKTVRAVLAANPDAPAAVIAALAGDNDESVAAAARSNPACPDEAVLKARLADADKPMATDTDIDGLAFEELARLAGSTQTAVDKLVELAGHELGCIRFLVGFNTSTPADTLASLAKDAEAWVAAGAAFNPKTPPESLAALVPSSSIEIQLALASNPGLSEPEQLKLAESAAERVAETLAHLTTYPSVWTKLAEDPPRPKPVKQKDWRHFLREMLESDGKRRFVGLTQGIKSQLLCISRVAARTEDCPPKFLKHYAHYLFADYSQNPAAALALLEGKTHVKPQPYKDWKVNMWLSERRAPGMVSNFFVQSDDDKRRAQAVNSPTTQLVYVIPMLLDDNTRTRKAVAQRRDLNHAAFEILLRDSKPGVREEAAKNKRCPKALLSLVKGDKATTVRAVVNKRSNAGTTGGMVNKGSATERARLAKKTDSAELLNELAEDRATSVRVTVAQNYETPEAVLVKLTSDKDPKVRRAAARRCRKQEVLRNLLSDADLEVCLTAARSSLWRTYERETREYHWDQNFLGWISTAEDDEIRAIAAEHTTDRKLQAKFMDDVPSVTHHLAKNKHMTADDRLTLANNTSDQDTLGALAYRTEHEDLFLLCAKKITSSHVDDPIRCHGEMLSRPKVQDQVCTHPLSNVRWALCNQRTLTPRALEALAADPEESIRRAINRRSARAS